MAWLQCRNCPRTAHTQPYGPAYVTMRDCLGNCIKTEEQAPKQTEKKEPPKLTLTKQ